MKKRLLKKSEVLREGYVKGLRKAQSIINRMLMESYDDSEEKYVEKMMALAKECVDDTNQFNGCLVVYLGTNSKVDCFLLNNTVSEAVQSSWVGGAKVQISRNDLTVKGEGRHAFLYGIKKDSSVEEIDDLIDRYKHAKSAALRDPELKDDEISIEREILSHAAHLGKFFEGRL